MDLTELKKREIVASKSWKYLGCTLRKYGRDFLMHLRISYCVATGIGDNRLTHLTGEHYDKHLFLLFDTQEKPEKFEQTMEFFREHKSYTLDYPFEHPTLDLHMVVLKVPEEYHDSLEHFRNSRYSQMYDERQLATMFYPSERKYDSYMVLTKDSAYRSIFEDMVNGLSKDQHQRTRISLSEDSELDFQFKPEQEIFNYDFTTSGTIA